MFSANFFVASRLVMLICLIVKTADLVHFIFIHHFIPVLVAASTAKKNQKPETKAESIGSNSDKTIQTWITYADYGFEFLEVIYALIWITCGLFICFILHIMKQN